MVSNKNRVITIKVSKSAYDFMNTLSKKYGVSISAFCQDCVTQSILNHDLESMKFPTVEGYYQKLAFFINETYDLRRKK